MSKLSKLLIAVFTALVAVGITIVIADDPDNPGHQTVTITLGGQHQTKIELSPQAQVVATAQATPDRKPDDTELHADLRGAAPSSGEVQQGNKLLPNQQPIPPAVTLAAPSARGCVSQFVANQSSRNGAKVTLGVIHWTGSRSIPGSWSDVSAIVSWFNQARAQASSNYIVDDDGHCSYIVPETSKAWTQAAANPWAVSVEYVNPGVLPLFHGPAGRARVVSLMRGWHKRWGIPYQIGAVNSSCVPTRAGFLAHRDLGPCGGGHPDVGVPSIVPSLVREAAQGTPRAITARDHRDCVKIQRYNAARPRVSARWTKAVEFRRARVHSHGLYCSHGRVHRRK